MLCASLGLQRHTTMVEQHVEFARRGADLVELRLGYIKRAVNLERLLATKSCPVIVTCRRESEGGLWTDAEDKRLTLLRAAIAAGVAYIDLEEDVAGKIPRFGKTKRIVSFHSLKDTPDNLAEIQARLAALDADVVKITTRANSLADSLRMLDFLRSAPSPTVGICTGDFGVITQVLGAKFGSPIVYGSFHSKRPLFPGQLGFDELASIYRCGKINSKTAVYGIVAESLDDSPYVRVLNQALETLELNAVAVPIRSPKDDLSQLLDACGRLGIRGLCLFPPVTYEAFKRISKADRNAAMSEAVDTLLATGDETAGYHVFPRAVSDYMSVAIGGKATDENSQFLIGTTTLILGSGHAARAVAHAVKHHGGDLVVAARNHESAQEIAVRVDARIVDWSSRYSFTPTFLVNCTPVGAYPDVDATPFDKQHFHRSMVVVDCVYNPEQTVLLKEARHFGCKVVSGADLFVRRAALQFRAFTGQKAPTDLMWKTVKQATGLSKVN